LYILYVLFIKVSWLLNCIITLLFQIYQGHLNQMATTSGEQTITTTTENIPVEELRYINKLIVIAFCIFIILCIFYLVTCVILFSSAFI